jgi:hypothetical protein
MSSKMRPQPRNAKNFRDQRKVSSGKTNESRLGPDRKTNESRLGPDRIRREYLTSLLRKADSVACTPNKPFVFPSQEAPAAPSIAVGDGVNLADRIRIFEQYAQVVSQSCLSEDPQGFLSGAHLPPQLAWFNPLRERVHSSSSLEPTFHEMLKLFREAAGASPAPGEPYQPIAAIDLYNMQRTLPHVDIELVRYMLRLGRPSATGYEAHISCHLLRKHPELSWVEHQERLDAWRDEGLRYPLLLAAAFMPTLNDWLAVELHREGAGWGEFITELNSAQQPEQTEAVLSGIDTRLDWSSPAGLAIAGTLDRLAVAMRLLSNAGPGASHLDTVLREFPDWAGKPVGAVWKQARSALESAIPPCMLCPRLAGFGRATWGYLRLTPVYVDGAVRFEESALEWVTPLKEKPPAPLSDVDKKELARQSGARLQDVLCRMGEVALSPEMGHMMMLAVEGLYHLRDGVSSIKEHEQQYCQTPEMLLHFMRNAGTLASDDQDIQDFVESLFSKMPHVWRVDQPLRIVGWRVDPPPRIVLHTGRGLGTTLLDERSDVSHVGGVFTLPGPDTQAPDDTVLRKSLSAGLITYLRTHLRAPLSETVRLDDNRKHTHTALHTGLVEFALQEPLLHTIVRLHESSRWENDRQDTR